VDTVRIEAIVQAQKSRPGAMLPVLHEIQAAFGYIPEQAIPIVAQGLNLSRAEVHGVITFYADFRTSPPGQHIVQVCRGEACQAIGGQELEAHAKRSLGVDFHQTTPDRRVTLEPVYCLGNCGCSPSVRVGDQILGRVSPQRFDQIVARLSEEPRP